MRVPHPVSSSPKVRDGSGVNTPARMTGHGAPASASGRGNEPMPGLRSNNWGASTLSKLQAPFAVGSTGQTRFIQPTLAETAQVPPPGLGNPRN